MGYRDDRVVLGQVRINEPPPLHRRKHHGGCGKELSPVTLDESGRRRADAHDEVERVLGEEGLEVVDEGRSGVSSSEKRAAVSENSGISNGQSD